MSCVLSQSLGTYLGLSDLLWMLLGFLGSSQRRMGLHWTEWVGCVFGGRLGWRRESRDRISFLGTSLLVQWLRLRF